MNVSNVVKLEKEEWGILCYKVPTLPVRENGLEWGQRENVTIPYFG